MIRSILPAILAAVLCTACGNSSTTAPTTETARSTLIFAGTLAARDAQFYSFTVLTPGQTDITLVSLRPNGTARTTLAASVGLGIGTPAGEGCKMSTSVNTQPGLAAQVTSQTTDTIYCVNVYDIGSITDPVDFTIRVVHP